MAKFSFAAMKDKLKGNVIKEEKSYDDERVWRLKADEQGNGSALVRLLPGGIDKPAVVKVTMHEIFLKDAQGKWHVYKEKSPQTIGKKCPVTEAYFELKNAGEEYKDVANKLQRRNKIFSNVLIKKDLQNPDNNGQIKIWDMPKTIWDGCLAVLDPSEQEIELGKQPKELFDLQEGCDLMIARKGKGLNTTYTVSFKDKEPLCDESENEKYLSKVYDLDEYLRPDTFKSYDELKEIFARTISDSEIEEALLRIGSKVITKPYNQQSINENVTSTTSNSYTPSQSVSEPKEVKTEPKVESQVETSDDIDSLLDDL